MNLNKDFKVGDKVEWIENGFQTGTVTLIDYDRIVVDGKHNVQRIDLYHEGCCPFSRMTANELARQERHQEVCGYVKNWAYRICSDRLYSDLSVTEEDLKDGKVTFRFSLTPADGKSPEELGVTEDKDARITELEEHLHRLLGFCVSDCNDGTRPITKEYWRTVYHAVECMNRSAWPHLHIEDKVSHDNVKED